MAEQSSFRVEPEAKHGLAVATAMLATLAPSYGFSTCAPADRTIGFGTSKLKNCAYVADEKNKATGKMIATYTETAAKIATDQAKALIDSALTELFRTLPEDRSVVIDGVFDPDTGHPTLAVKVVTDFEQLRPIRAALRSFQANDWWWDRRNSAAVQIVFTAGR